MLLVESNTEMERRFYLLDVFAEGPYSGNQLAVFRNASSLMEDDMLRLAREVHFSETAFILSDVPREGGYDVRVFTPVHEIPFSGHAVLGAAWVLQRELLDESPGFMRVNLGVGTVYISFDYHHGDLDAIWMAHRSAEYGPLIDVESAALAVGLEASEVDSRWPIQEVSTGLPFIMIPVPSMDIIQRARIEPGAYDCLSAASTAKAILLFTPETYNPENDFNIRMFAPEYGVREDPASGAGACSLAAYVIKHVRPLTLATLTCVLNRVTRSEGRHCCLLASGARRTRDMYWWVGEW